MTIMGKYSHLFFGFWSVLTETSSKTKSGSKKKKREITATEKPAKFVIKMEIYEAKIAKFRPTPGPSPDWEGNTFIIDFIINTMTEKSKKVYDRKPRVPVVAR